MVKGVPGRVPDRERRAAELEGVSVVQRAHARRWNGGHRAVEIGEARLAVDRERPRDELLRRDEVLRRARVGEERCPRAGGEERPGARGVIEVGVGDDDVAHVLGAFPVRFERAEETGKGAGGVRFATNAHSSPARRRYAAVEARG